MRENASCSETNAQNDPRVILVLISLIKWLSEMLYSDWSAMTFQDLLFPDCDHRQYTLYNDHLSQYLRPALLSCFSYHTIDSLSIFSFKCSWCHHVPQLMTVFTVNETSVFCRVRLVFSTIMCTVMDYEVINRYNFKLASQGKSRKLGQNHYTGNQREHSEMLCDTYKTSQWMSEYTELTGS